MLSFAAISPHPPIIIPEIGQKGDLEKAAATVQAMKKLAHLFSQAEIDTLIVISPHMLIYPDKFNLAGMKKLFGSFASFGAPDIMLEGKNDLELARKIDDGARKADIKTLLYDNDGEFFELDHGVMVPLFYLSQNQESAFRILPLTYSNLPRAVHFSYGQVLGEAIKSYPGRVGIVASGDLSHRLLHGRDEEIAAGQDFDRKLRDDLQNNRTEEILCYDEDFIDKAGECGYRSILILLGALDGMKVVPEILSYEGPFGVGYLVGYYKLNR